MTASTRDIVNGALELVGQVSGSGVQVYADEFALRCCVRAFDMLFKKRNWDQYLRWYVVTLDGVNGIITQDAFEAVRDFEDFIGVYRSGHVRSLPVFTHNVNVGDMTGDRPRYWTSLHVTHEHYAKRRLQFYPYGSQDTLFVQARVYPLPTPAIQWGWSDIMHLDKSMMEEATAFVMLSVDAINADAANVCKSMMEARYIDIVASMGSRPMRISGTANIPDQWYVTR